jgi:hypothetical protein
MSSHGALQQSVMAQRIESLVLPVALPGGEDQRKAPWFSILKKSLLKRDQ